MRIERNGVAATPTTRLLIVDDHTQQLQALCDTLLDHGFAITGCANGEQALQRLLETPFDMLLTDLMMPAVNGIELLRKALRIDPTLSVIVVTGEGSIASAVEAMQSGAHDYLLKPFKLSVILPVIERCLAMRRLRMANLALERQVLLRTAELEASNAELEAFTRSASHDLRSPLQGVLGFTQLLQQETAPHLTQRECMWLANIEASARRMITLIDDLMRLSRLGRQAVCRRAVNVAAMVQGVLQELDKAYPDRVAQVVCGDLPHVDADESLLRQVFVNLLSNALKYTAHTANARIEISTETHAAEIVYCVRDNGPGFDMAQADMLFQPFQRLPSAEGIEGSGIGLSIVQRIVQRHGGRVWAEAAPGQGATFRFTLGEGSATPKSCDGSTSPA